MVSRRLVYERVKLGLVIAAGVGTLGLAIYGAFGDTERNRIRRHNIVVNEGLNTLPKEVRSYDLDRNNSLDSYEMSLFLRDKGLESK